jgi:hypothetical protein
VKSWQLMDYVISQKRITGRHFAVAIAIASRFNAKEGCARPSLGRIAEDARVSIATVKRSILALEKIGELRIDRLGKTNRYVFAMAQGEPLEGATIAQGEPSYSSHSTQTRVRVSHEPKRTERRTERPSASVVPIVSKPPTQTPRRLADDEQLVQLYAELWEGKYGSKPILIWARERKVFRGLLEQASVSVLESALRAYVACDSDTWLRDNRHPLTAFASQINRYMPTKNGAKPGTAAVPDATAWRRNCQHVPVCENAYQHESRSEAACQTA